MNYIIKNSYLMEVLFLRGILVTKRRTIQHVYSSLSLVIHMGQYSASDVQDMDLLWSGYPAIVIFHRDCRDGNVGDCYLRGEAFATRKTLRQHGFAYGVPAVRELGHEQTDSMLTWSTGGNPQAGLKAGYYDTPREATLTNGAGEFGVSKATMTSSAP